MNQEQFKKIKETLNSISQDNSEAVILLDYFIDFYECNKLLLNKDGLIIYRDLIRACNGHLSQIRDNKESRKTFFRRMKSHHHIMLLLGKPKTDEEKEEYARYVDIQYGSDKTLDEMLGLRASDVIDGLEVVNNIEGNLLNEYYKIFYKDNGICLNKDELIIYRDLIRACNGHLSQDRDDEISEESLFAKMKAHHHIMLLLGKPETDEEKEEYERYVEIQYGSDKNLDGMLGLRASDVIDELGGVNNIEGNLLNEYYKIFYKDNGICLNKDELIIYRDLIRECKYHLSQSRDDEISEESLFAKMKAHHHILLLLGEPETDEGSVPNLVF